MKKIKLNEIRNNLLEAYYGSGTGLHDVIIVESLIKFIKSEFNINPSITVRASVSKFKDGSVNLNAESVHHKHFILRYNRKRPYDYIIRNIIHEMIHVKQIYNGELSYSPMREVIIWKNRDFMTYNEFSKSLRNMDSYLALPWEVEARKYENDPNIVRRWLNSKYVDDIRDKNKKVDIILDSLS